jgi:hypothetical protein
MAGCDPHRRAGRLGACAARFALSCVAAALTATAPAIGHAQPALDLTRAKDLYLSGEAAMKDGRFDDAARDYGAAYELSQDTALFYKIGHANERAGKCDVALIYFARYLREGKPNEQFVALTREHIKVCGGEPPSSGSPARDSGSGEPAGPDSGTSGVVEAGGASAATPRDGAGAAGNTASGNDGTAAGAAGAAPPATASGNPAAGAAEATLVPPNREKVAWLLGGSAIAFATLGGVLAYAASSSENDVRDLYAGLAGQTPTFDGATRKRYDDLVAQGERYQHLSWAAFGLAGAAAIGVTVLFLVGRDDEPAHPPPVTPVVGPRSAGVSVRF